MPTQAGTHCFIFQLPNRCILSQTRLSEPSVWALPDGSFDTGNFLVLATKYLARATTLSGPRQHLLCVLRSQHLVNAALKVALFNSVAVELVGPPSYMEAPRH